MKKSFVVIGLGRFGLGVAQTLTNLNVDVLAIDQNEEAVVKASDTITHCVICDSTNENNLRRLGVGNVDHAIVAIGSSIQATILTTIVLKELNVPIITVRVDDDYFVPIIMKLGATEVISPEKVAAKQLANRVISDTFMDYYNISDEYAVVQVAVNPKFKPIVLVDLDSRNKFDINIVMINRDGKFFIPKGTDEILPNDSILVLGKLAKVTKFDQYINS